MRCCWLGWDWLLGTEHTYTDRWLYYSHGRAPPSSISWASRTQSHSMTPKPRPASWATFWVFAGAQRHEGPSDVTLFSWWSSVCSSSCPEVAGMLSPETSCALGKEKLPNGDHGKATSAVESTELEPSASVASPWPTTLEPKNLGHHTASPILLLVSLKQLQDSTKRQATWVKRNLPWQTSS